MKNRGMAGLFGAVTERLEGATTMAGPAVYAIWAVVIGIVITLILLVADYFYPFLPFNPVSGPSALARAGKTFWTSVDTNAENLIVPASDSPTKGHQYSVSFHLAITDSRTPSPGVFRHILHRGTNPVGITAASAGTSGHANIQPEDLPQPGEPTYVHLRLPQIMNPGVFLDKYKNDIHVFIHTKGKEEGMEVLLLESATIEDLPMNTPMTIGIVCTGRTLELYVNCRLYNTLLLRGVPYLPKADNQWFGRYGVYPFTGIIKHLTLWAAPLGSSDYMQVCQGFPPSIPQAEMPTACSVSGGNRLTATATTTATATPAKNYLGFSATTE
jgi:hypothetical protein